MLRERVGAESQEEAGHAQEAKFTVEEWDKLPQTVIDRFVDSFRDKNETCLLKKGGLVTKARTKNRSKGDKGSPA